MKSITNFINESLGKLDLSKIHYSITPYDLGGDRNTRNSNAKKNSFQLAV